MTVIIPLTILFVILVLILLEGVFYFLLRNPGILRLLSRKLQNSISYLYVQGDRKIMQFQKGYGRHDPDFGYTLKPGAFIFEEVEFSNEYCINSLGVRDSEEALVTPEIIFLGDSFALGWGVDQEETFVKLIENKTKLKTINTSIPSFGTVREMMMLKKMDRSRLKCLILQYCGDDYDENLLYYRNGDRPQIMRAQTFQSLTQFHSKDKSYYPGKYLRLKIRKKIGEWKTRPTTPEQENPPGDVDLFLHVLKQNTDLLAGVPLIVFEMNGINQTNFFTKQLQQTVKAPGQPSFIQEMIILDMSQYLKDLHFYVLDGHLNASGHIIVADILYHVLQRAGIQQHHPT